MRITFLAYDVSKAQLPWKSMYPCHFEKDKKKIIPYVIISYRNMIL